jgi:hypothetical protein
MGLSPSVKFSTFTNKLRGLLFLHESRYHSFPLQESATYFLQTSLNGMSWIAIRFNQKIDQIDMDVMSLFPTHSIYMGTMQQERLWRDTGDLRCFEAVKSLLAMLRHFGRKWLGASKCIFFGGGQCR